MTEKAKQVRKQVDWEALEPHYRSGIRSLKDIGAEFGCSDAAIVKHARNNGWSRSLATRQGGGIALSELDQMSGHGYVYALAIDTGLQRFYKIGLALRPDVRATAHQTSLPFEARLVIAYFVTNMRQEERVLHQMFADKRVRGEWFELDDSDLDRMASRARIK